MTAATIFGPLHASWYDRWHHRKDYPAEVAQIRQVFQEVSQVDSVLDLGCGTARHLELLAEAGYAVTGVDSSSTMAANARQRLARFSRADVVESDLLDLALDRTFDAVTMMFSVLGYQVTTAGLLAALATAHRHLRPGGVLVCDILDGVVVLREGVTGGVTVVTDGTQRLLRATTGALDDEAQVYELRMRLWLLDGDRLVEHIEENHPLRFFFARELELLLSAAGFELVGSAPLAGGQPGPSRGWSRLVWARRT